MNYLKEKIKMKKSFKNVLKEYRMIIFKIIIQT